MFNDRNSSGQLKNLFLMFEILKFGHCDLFDICDLEFGI
jgi:hypothetical protein